MKTIRRLLFRIGIHRKVWLGPTSKLWFCIDCSGAPNKYIR